MNFPSNNVVAPAENTSEGRKTMRLERASERATERPLARTPRAPTLDKGTAMTVAVIPADGTEPVASFPDMETAMAWGLQQYKGSPFIVRVYTDEQATATETARPTPARRRPAAKATAVSNILRTVRSAAQEDFSRDAGSVRKAAAH